MAKIFKNKLNLTALRGFRTLRLLTRAILWGIAILLTALIAWIAWVIVMSGGGIELMTFALVLAAPWPLFHLVASRRARSSRVDRAPRD
ncbi:hypothetical protein [Streptomyces sp. NPDC017991]|uniref:hypothetical protein n=1 Tax=Streptomyces sp. NPDC017991 TaxID=3365026 RepID=UPI0037884247